MSQAGFYEDLLYILAHPSPQIQTAEQLCDWLALNHKMRYKQYETARGLCAVLRTAQDISLRPVALEWLRRFDSPAAINTVCSSWADSRNPDLLALLREKQWSGGWQLQHQVLTALKLNHLEKIRPDASRLRKLDSWLSDPKNLSSTLLNSSGNWRVLLNYILISATSESDPEIAGRAANLVSEWLNELAQRYYTWPSVGLRQLLEQHNYPLPGENSVLDNLMNDDWESLTNCGPELVPQIIQASESMDADVAYNARQVLENLERPEAQQVVCDMILERAWPVAEAAALMADYRPGDPYRQVLFYFLTEQWDRYESLDFDRRLLQAAFLAGDPSLRRRLAEKVRISGRVDFLEIIAGQSAKSLTDLTGEEADLLINVLAEHKAWAQLWTLCSQLALPVSVTALGWLLKANWQPASFDDQTLYRRLQGLSQVKITTRLAELWWVEAGSHLTAWFTQPLGQLEAHHLGELADYLANSQLDRTLQTSLRYVEAVLQHRFRHAIELGEAVSLPPEEYDIEVEFELD